MMAGDSIDPRHMVIAHVFPEVRAVESAIKNERGTGHQGGEQSDHFGIDVKRAAAD
jgi:hypothetical protein